MRPPAALAHDYDPALAIKTKEAGLPAPAQKPEPRPHNVINIVDALRRSIESEKAAPSRAAETVEKRNACQRMGLTVPEVRLLSGHRTMSQLMALLSSRLVQTERSSQLGPARLRIGEV
jgi:hypothetical protein